jgi:outer membrane protein insertion porin family
VRRGVVTAVVACVLAAGAADAAAPADTRNPSWLQRRLETGLAQATGGTVRIGRMDVDWTKLSATVGDVAISIPAPGAPPLTATIGEGRIKLAWSGLPGIGGGQVHITEVIARGATFSLSREWIDAFTPKSKGGGPVAVQIDRVVIENAAAEYLDGGEHVRVRTTAMDFRGAWSTSRQLLVGEVRADATVEAPIFNRAWPATVRGGLRLGAGRLEIFGATAKGPGASAELAGNVTWDVGASFTAQGSLDADLATLAPFLVGQTGISGRASGPVQIVYTGGVPIRVVMQAATTGFRIGPITTETARADLTIRPGHLEVDVIDARAYRGAFNGTVGLTFGNPLELRTDLSGRGADLARLISLAGKDLPISSAADVTFKVVGDPGKLATWSGGGTFTASPVPAGASGRIPAGGRGRLTFASGQIRVIADSLEAAEASLRFAFDAELAGARSHRLSLDGTTRDARKTQVATMAILDAFGVERNRFVVEPLTGAGGLHAALVTSGKSTTFDLGLDLASGSYAGEPFDRATLDLGIGNNAVTIRRVDLTGSGQSLAGSVRIDTRTHALDEIDLVARNLGIAKLLTSVGVTAAVDGRVELDLRGYREDGVFAALGHLQAANVIVGHEIIDTVEGPVRIEGDRLVLVPLVAKSDGLDARLSVIYDLANGEATVNVEDATIDVGCNRTLADAGLAAMGTIRTEGLLTITRDGPSGLLSVDADELLLDTGRGGLREILLGDLAGSATIAPRGVELAVASLPDRAWTFEAFLGFDPKLPLSAVLYFEDLLVGAGGTLGESVDVRLKGQVQAEGDLTEPRAMEINGGFDEVAVRLGPRVVKSVAAFPLRLDNGRFALGPAQFAGESSDLEMGASGSIEAGDIAGYLKGKLDLAIVSSLWSELRGAGPLTIDATLAGTLERPDYGGRITVRDGRLRLIGYPQSLESIDAEAVLAGQTLTLTSFHAVQGGGEIAATGRVEFTGVVPTSLTAEFTGANVSAKYPEGFKGTYQGTIGIEGTRKRATISGRIEVVRGLYSKDFDVGLFGGSHREFDAAAESPFPRNIFLDVDIVAPGNVWLRNDVASVEAEGQIHLGGELARPEVTGHFNLLPGGTVTYRDVEYRIDYGTLDQTDPKRINPYLEFRGHTKVAEYDIALRIEGTLDKFEYELTSTPPLDSQDIISLLVTGKTLDTLSGSATAAAVPTDMAAYYFAGLLNTTFGKQIQTSLGIDTLAITPQLLKGESDPTARVTVGKQVSDTVKIAFSQDIGTAQKQTYSVSWDATRRIRFVAEDDTEEGLGGELQYARQFGGTPMASTKIEGAGVVASVQVVTDDGTPRPDLVKKTKLVVGKPFDRGRMLQGGDRIRSALLKQGFIQATVRAEATLDPDKTDAYQIVYRVTVGPKIVVEVVMSDGGGKRSAKKSLKAFWRETPYTPDFWDEATRAMLDDLQERGYYAADVTWHATDGPSGRTVRVLVDRGKAVRLRAVRFTGGTSIPRERIDKQMTSMRSQGLRKRLLKPSVLTADLAAVRALFREEGYTRVVVSPPQISLSADGASAEVDVTINEGTRYSVGEIGYSGGSAATEAQLRAWTLLKQGETFSPRRLAEAEQALKERFDVLGYPDVSVESRVELVGERADIVFEITTGDRKTVGKIAIQGNRVTKDRTIARALTFGVGEVVSNEALLASQQRLYRTGLFSNVKLTCVPESQSDPTAQVVTVKVDEAPPLALGLGVGYDSSDGPGMSFLIGYSNLGGRNVAIALQGRVSRREQRELLTVRRKRVFGNTIDSLGSLLFEKSVEDGFSKSERTLSIRLEQRPKPRWIRFLRYSIQQVKIYDTLDPQKQLDAIFEDKLSQVRLGSFGLGLVRDTRDDAFLPTRGGYGSIEGTVFAKPFGSEATFLQTFLRGSWTVTTKNGNRFSSFLRIGAEYPFAGTEIVPLSERYFAGGINTLRGFATDSVGGIDFVVQTTDPDGNTVTTSYPIGGEAIFLFNQDWSFPIWGSLRGELFFDAGNVYPTLNDFDPSDLRYDAGVGLRLDTPIGPLRLEYGWKLDRQPDESAGELVFAIGTLF